MATVQVAVYDDELTRPAGRNVAKLVEWLNEVPNCQVSAFSRACALTRAVADGLRPHVAVIDINGMEDPEPPENLRAALAEARSCGLDYERHIDMDLLRERGLDDWLERCYYGIGLLALLRAALCPQRMAFTVLGRDVSVVEPLKGGLANLAVLPKDDLKEACRRLGLVIEEARELLVSSRPIPDTYEVLVREDVDEEGDEGFLKRLRVRIAEKKTPGRIGEVEFSGDHAVAFGTIADANGDIISSRRLLSELNKTRGARDAYVRLAPLDIRQLLEKLGVQLEGEKSENSTRDMCRVANDNLCSWQQRGALPPPGREGHSCYMATLSPMNPEGYCPKLMLKRRPTRPFENRLEDESSARRIVGELQRRYLSKLDGIFGPEFSGPNGIIRTIRGKGGGYALAGTITYADE